MVKINWTPNETQLRRFGWIGLFAFPLLGWLFSILVPGVSGMDAGLVFGAVALACGAFALFSPMRLKPIYLLAIFLGPLLIITLIFFAVQFFLGNPT